MNIYLFPLSLVQIWIYSSSPTLCHLHMSQEPPKSTLEGRSLNAIPETDAYMHNTLQPLQEAPVHLWRLAPHREDKDWDICSLWLSRLAKFEEAQKKGQRQKLGGNWLKKMR